MIAHKILDKSETKLLSHMLIGGELYSLNFVSNTNRLVTHFALDNWFAQRLKDIDIVDFLKFSIEGTEGASLNSLLYSFTWPGTFESIVQLCFGLFGLQSVVLITTQPAVIGVSVKNANTTFLSGAVSTLGQAMVNTNESEDWVTFEIFSQLGATNLNSFFLEFLPAGTLLSLDINTGA